MKVKGPVILIFFLSLPLFLFSNQKLREKDLPEQYRDWLKITSYIILPQEKEVFMQLTNNRDRNIFIEAFWKMRDPTPGTPENEYKDEHIKRFLYANKHFHRGTPREGWMTDMGRIYIILGAPVSIESFEVTPGIYPCQVWYYYGDKAKGLPTYFALVFYQRGGAGEFKLYSPTSDGPADLIIDKTSFDPSDYQQIYKKIKELAPTLANVSISMIPGQYPYNYQPSPQENIILAKILESPKKEISPSYATHFLNYKGEVSTEYLTNYVESDTAVTLVQDPVLGINFLHFSIAPKTVSIDYYEPKDQYYCNFKLDVSMRRGEEIIFQYSKDFPFYFSPNDIDGIRGNGIAIQDSFPVIEGEYELNILVQNSVGKEFTVFEKKIHIPEKSATPAIIGPMLGYDLQDYKSPMHVPFKFADKKLLVDPKNTFSSADNISIFFSLTNVEKSLWSESQVKITIQGLKTEKPSQKSYVLELKDYPYSRTLNISYSLSAKELSPDYYEIKLALLDRSGKMVDEGNSQFIISPLDTIPHPVTLAKAFPLSSNFLYFYSLAYQYDKVNKNEKAEENYEKAIALKHDYPEGIVEYAEFLLKVGKFEKSLEWIEKAKESENVLFDYYFIKGKALLGMGQYSEAINNLLEGNKIYNSDTGLLNSLGFSYYKTGQKKKALEVLRVSLHLNPEQKNVENLIDEIEKSHD